MTERTMVVAGATGLVGAAIVDAAVRRGWRVVALVRPGRSFRDHDDILALTCDFDDLAGLRDRLAASDPVAFVCALGTTIRTAGSEAAFARVDRDYVGAFARLGIAVGATRFGLVSSIGADPRSGNFYLRTKGEAEALVRSAGYARVEIARPSLLLGARAERRIIERATTPIAQALTPLLVGGLSKYRPIRADLVARALVAGVGRDEPGIFIRHHDDLAALASA